MTQIGHYRRLQTLSTPAGHFNILAVDHRDALRVALRPNAPDSVQPQELIAIKLRLLAHLGHLASAVMLEPEFSMAQAIAAAVVPPDKGFTAAIEAQGYLADPSVAVNSTLPGWSVQQAARAGAAAAKILVLWDPEDEEAQSAQMTWIKQVLAECRLNSLPLLLEPIIRKDVSFDHHLAMIERMAELSPGILKLAIPHGEARFDLLQEASGAEPWVLLSAGVTYEQFHDQVAGACQAGASGFAVGRALWGDYLKASEDEAETAIAEMLARFRGLCDLTAAHAAGWHGKVAPPATSTDWFKEEGK